MKYLLLSLIILSISACNTLPASIHQAPDNNLQLRSVEIDLNAFIGHQIRWGGRIINVRNDNGISIFEIEQLPMNRYGFPMSNIPSQGRFIAQSNKIIDITEYQTGLLITFSGEIVAVENTRVGGEKGNIPRIEINESHLWPYKIADGKAYTITGMTSQHHSYGYYGSGLYQIY